MAFPAPIVNTIIFCLRIFFLIVSVALFETALGLFIAKHKHEEHDKIKSYNGWIVVAVIAGHSWFFGAMHLVRIGQATIKILEEEEEEDDGIAVSGTPIAKIIIAIIRAIGNALCALNSLYIASRLPKKQDYLTAPHDYVLHMKTDYTAAFLVTCASVTMLISFGDLNDFGIVDSFAAAALASLYVQLDAGFSWEAGKWFIMGALLVALRLAIFEFIK